MPRYKRTRDEAELDLPVEPQVAPEHQATLLELRNMWEFASLMQYIYLFGGTVKIDESFDIEDLESECLSPTPSDKLASIGLALLKYVSSHRGLTPEIFDEYTRRQYDAKAPDRNPFGNDDEPTKFNDLDVFTRIRVLQQLSTWSFNNADRIRGLMPADDDHLNWRMEPLGWDKEDRSYFVLDDNRLYRRSDEPLPPPTPRITSKSKKKTPKKTPSRGTRTSKRRKIEDTEDEEMVEQDAEADQLDDTAMANGEGTRSEEDLGFGFTSKTWECVAVTLGDYQEFMASIFRSRDPNERQLRSMIEQDVLPIIEKRAEAMRQKQLKKVRERDNLQKMATAKRSSRLADKADREKQEREEREVEDRRQRDLRMAHEEQERQKRIEEGHESRRLTREQRTREREARRILHQEELAKLEEETSRAQSQDPNSDGADIKRISERQLKTQKEEHQRELDKLAEEEDGKWYFDCSICGMHGDNLDDGSHSIACDRCSVWQHSKCHGLTPKQAQREDFKFICATCKRKEEDALKPKMPRPDENLDSPRTSSRPTTGEQANNLPINVDGNVEDISVSKPQRLLAEQYQSTPSQRADLTTMSTGSGFSPRGEAEDPGTYRLPPVGNFAPRASQQAWPGHPLPALARRPSSGNSETPPSSSNGYDAHSQQQLRDAAASAGSHRQYEPHTSPQASKSDTSAGIRTVSHPPLHSTPQHNHNHHFQPPSARHQQQGQTPGPPAQLMNGFQSPVKQQPSSSPASSASHSFTTPQPLNQQHHPSFHQYQRSPKLQQSPKTNLPPPVQDAARGVSPVKASPPSQTVSNVVASTPQRNIGQHQASPALNAPRLMPTSPQPALQHASTMNSALAPSPVPHAANSPHVNGSA